MNDIGDCLWRIDSGEEYRPGPPGRHLMVLGGVHGNELSGIMIVRELLERFERSPGDLLHGKLTLGFGNPAAIARGLRGSAPHRDLNRSFLPQDRFNPSVYEHCRARELARHFFEANVLIDLHATNKPSEPFLATTKLTPHHLRLAQAFPCDNLVVVSPEAIEGTTDGWMNDRGRVGFIYESGLASDLTNLQALRDAVAGVMALEGLTADALPPTRPPKTVFAMKDAIRLTDAGFRFADGRGLRSFEPVRAGDVIGYAGTDPVVAPYDGVLMFPKVPELWKVGSPLFFLAAALDRP